MLTGTDQENHIDLNDRIGKVFKYSDTGGIGTNVEQQAKNDVQYRFRHVNTGRLVID